MLRSTLKELPPTSGACSPPRRRAARRRLHGRNHRVTDTIDPTFDSVLAKADEGATRTFATPSEIELGYGEPGPRLDESLLDQGRSGRRRR